MQIDDDINQAYFTDHKIGSLRGSDRDQFRADGSRKEFGWSITAQPRETGVLRFSSGMPVPDICGPDNSAQASTAPHNLRIADPQLRRERYGTWNETFDILLHITVLATLIAIPLVLGFAVILKALAYFGLI